MINLGNVLMFSTGIDHPPPMGFPSHPEISLIDDDKRTLPYVSTCGPTLYLTLTLRDPDVFQDRMDMAFLKLRDLETHS